MRAGRFGPRPPQGFANAFPRRFPARVEAPILAPTARRPAFPRLAKRILDDYWSFHPTTAAAFGIHRYDGMLPVYTAATLRAFTTRVREYIDALDRLDRGDGLTRKVRLRLGVLRGLLLTELSEIEDQRLPNALPPYFLFRMNIVNYLVRKYAPLDRRVRAIGKLESQVPRFLKELRSTLDRRLADSFFEVGEMAATGMLDAYSRELPEILGGVSPKVRTYVETRNETATAELKAFVSDLATKYRPRLKTDFALGRRKYERMIFAEHLVRIPIERLLEVGRAGESSRELREDRSGGLLLCDPRRGNLAGGEEGGMAAPPELHDAPEHLRPRMLPRTLRALAPPEPRSRCGPQELLLVRIHGGLGALLRGDDGRARIRGPAAEARSAAGRPSAQLPVHLVNHDAYGGMVVAGRDPILHGERLSRPVARRTRGEARHLGSWIPELYARQAHDQEAPRGLVRATPGSQHPRIPRRAARTWRASAGTRARASARQGCRTRAVTSCGARRTRRVASFTTARFMGRPVGEA